MAGRSMAGLGPGCGSPRMRAVPRTACDRNGPRGRLAFPGRRICSTWNIQELLYPRHRGWLLTRPFRDLTYPSE